MRKNIIAVAAVLMCAATISAGAFEQRMCSPSGDLSLSVECSSGILSYSLSYKGQTVILPGRLGLSGDEADLTSGFEVVSVSRDTVDLDWTPVWGEYSSVREYYHEMAVTLEQPATGRVLTVRFRLFDDGLGFRYEIPEQDHINYISLRDEITEFNLTGDHLAFCIPGDYDTNEFAYSTARLSG